MEFSVTPSARNMVFVVDEAPVQQVFPMLGISPPLLYTPCHQGLVHYVKQKFISLKFSKS